MALILLANPKGGRPLSKFNTYCIDHRTGMSGYKLGYLDSECQRGEPVVIPYREISRFVEEMGLGEPKRGILGGFRHKTASFTSKPRKRQFWASGRHNYEIV
jgi:hypothetical protein